MATINMNFSGCDCYCLGGGAVGERRIECLLREGANVHLVSPTVTPMLARYHEEGRLNWTCGTYRCPEKRYDFAFIMTDDASVNAAAASDLRARGTYVNRADDRNDCDFTLPAETDFGGLRFTVSTGMLSPRVNRLIREDLEERYEPLAAFLPTLGEMRRIVKEKLRTPAEREVFWRAHLTHAELEDIVSGRRKLVEDRLQDAIGRIGIES